MTLEAGRSRPQTGEVLSTCGLWLMCRLYCSTLLQQKRLHAVCPSLGVGGGGKAEIHQKLEARIHSASMGDQHFTAIEGSHVHNNATLLLLLCACVCVCTIRLSILPHSSYFSTTPERRPHQSSSLSPFRRTAHARTALTPSTSFGPMARGKASTSKGRSAGNTRKTSRTVGGVASSSARGGDNDSSDGE